MNRTAACIAMSALFLTPIVSYAAEEVLPLVEIPKEYLQPAPQIGPGNPDRESAQALNGNNYSILTPILDGDDGNTSYVRFYNTNSLLPVVVTATIVGTSTGTIYGAAVVSVPAMASPQYSYRQVTDAAGVFAYLGADTSFSFYLRSSSDNVIYQHVAHNAINKFFENLSVCFFDPTFNYSGMSRYLGNVHTSSPYMTEYPSLVMLHHYGSSTGRYAARLYRSTDGLYLGGVAFTMGPNETFVAPVTWYEQSINWLPADWESHVNIVFSRDDFGTYQGLAGHAVANHRLGAYLNMTQFCGINKQF